VTDNLNMGLCASAHEDIVEDVVVQIAEKQPWAVIQKTLSTGDLLLLSGFEWIPQLTGRDKFFTEENRMWTYVGFVYIKNDTPFLIELESKDTLLRHMNGDFKSGAVKLVRAEDRIFKKKAGESNDVNYYTRGCIRHLQNYKQNKSDKIAIMKSINGLTGKKFDRDMKNVFQAHLAQGEFSTTVVDESEFFCTELVLMILEIYELLIKGTYNPLVVTTEDFEKMQNLERGAFYGAKIPINLDYGVGVQWDKLLIHYDPAKPMDAHCSKTLEETESLELIDTKDGEKLLKMGEKAANDAINFDKEQKFDEASELYKKAIGCLNQYIIMDKYFREAETGPFLTSFNETEYNRALNLLQKYRRRHLIVSHPTHMTTEEKKFDLELEEKVELKDWQKERNLTAADKLQHRTDDLIENIGDKIWGLFGSKKPKSKWSELLGKTGEDGEDNDDEQDGDAKEKAEKPKKIYNNPLLAKMRAKGLLKKKMSSTVTELVNSARLEKYESNSSGGGTEGSMPTSALENDKKKIEEDNNNSNNGGIEGLTSTSALENDKKKVPVTPKQGTGGEGKKSSGAGKKSLGASKKKSSAGEKISSAGEKISSTGKVVSNTGKKTQNNSPGGKKSSDKGAGKKLSSAGIKRNSTSGGKSAGGKTKSGGGGGKKKSS